MIVAKASYIIDKLVEDELYREARELSDALLEKFPHNSDAWRAKAELFAIVAQEEEAIKLFDKVLEINPKDISAWCIRGNILREIDREEEARQSYEKIALLEPDSISTCFYKQSALCNLERHDEAEKINEQYIEMRQIEKRDGRFPAGTWGLWLESAERGGDGGEKEKLTEKIPKVVDSSQLPCL